MLVDGKSHHILHRDSKLIRLLQDSVGDNTKKVIITNFYYIYYNLIKL